MSIQVIDIDDKGRSFLEFFENFIQPFIKDGRINDLAFSVLKVEKLKKMLSSVGYEKEIIFPDTNVDFHGFLFDGSIAIAGEEVNLRIKEIVDFRDKHKANNIGGTIVLFIGSMQMDCGFLNDFIEKWPEETPVFILHFF